ncbi:hypothetical protein GCM10022393_07380 [Aquimarina addita]|uniref:CysZ protein n=1 Tax=Aquimarina addita TaxID=870485 RepID=A0ABP7XBG4_9FLAO
MIKSIINGIKAYFGSFSLIFKLGLWKYFGVPIIISLCTGLFFATLIYFFADDVGYYIAKVWIWKWGSETFSTISTILGGLLIAVLALIPYKHIVMALSSPFMSPVSEKIEAYLLGDIRHVHRKTTFSEQLGRGIRINIRNLIREVLFVIPLVVLTFIPVIGLVFTILIFAIQAFYVGFGNMDYTMERHFKYKESIQFVKNHKGVALGNGIIFILMLFIPIIGFIIVLPISVVAASTETVKALKNEGFIKLSTAAPDVNKIES